MRARKCNTHLLARFVVQEAARQAPSAIPDRVIAGIIHKSQELCRTT